MISLSLRVTQHTLQIRKGVDANHTRHTYYIIRLYTFASTEILTKIRELF